MDLLFPVFPVSKFCIASTSFGFGFNTFRFPFHNCKHKSTKSMGFYIVSPVSDILKITPYKSQQGGSFAVYVASGSQFERSAGHTP